jgi:hypothetical protein
VFALDLGKMRGTLQPVANSDFKAAARRHHDDGRYLLNDNRLPNADQLAGLAAECALKAIMQFTPFGATPNPRGFLVWGPNARELRQHVNLLWSELAQNIGGYSTPTFAALLTGPTPFANWLVDDRYSDGTGVTSTGAIAHLDAAGQILLVLQQAQLDGYVS